MGLTCSREISVLALAHNQLAGYQSEVDMTRDYYIFPSKRTYPSGRPRMFHQDDNFEKFGSLVTDHCPFTRLPLLKVVQGS